MRPQPRSAPVAAATAQPQPQAGPALLRAIAGRIAALAASGDPIDALLAERLREDSALVAYIVGAKNERGHSVDLAVRRDAHRHWLRQLDRLMPTTDLHKELKRFQSNVFPHVAGKANPYMEGSRDYIMFEMLVAKNWVPAKAYLYSILKEVG